MAQIHPTAVIDPSATLAEDVEVGPFAVVEADVEIGRGTVLRPHSVVRRYTTLGAGNLVDSFAVLGGLPQDLKFDEKQVSYLRIGDGNIFREGVTISRATGEGESTVVGNNTYWFTNSHAGHNTEVCDEAILVNGALVAGHCTIGRGAILPANGTIHQFTWIGEKAMFQGTASASMHVPPYVMVTGVNIIVSLNKVGLRRSEEISAEDRKQIEEAFNITYRSKLSTSAALEKMDTCPDWGEAAGLFREFVRKVVHAEPPYNRGLCTYRISARQRLKRE
jgi:UDP-N-acetylglucosamine acyltransferase